MRNSVKFRPLLGSNAKVKHFPGSLVLECFTLGRAGEAAKSAGGYLSPQRDGLVLL